MKRVARYLRVRKKRNNHRGGRTYFVDDEGILSIYLFVCLNVTFLFLISALYCEVSSYLLIHQTRDILHHRYNGKSEGCKHGVILLRRSILS